MADTCEVTTHQIDDATTRTDARHHTTAERTELAKALLDVDGREMRERQRTDELLLGILVLLGIHGDRIRRTDALVARTGVGHHRNHGATHTGVAGQCRLGNDMREDRLAEDAMTQRTVDGLTQAVTIIALFALLGRTDVIVSCLQDETNIVERCCGGKVPHHAQGQLQLFLIGTAAKTSPLVQKHLATGFLIDEMGVAPGNDGRSLLAISIAMFGMPLSITM